jgi:hypothetical protein
MLAPPGKKVGVGLDGSIPGRSVKLLSAACFLLTTPISQLPDFKRKRIDSCG